jgi:hypothetical protein
MVSVCMQRDGPGSLGFPAGPIYQIETKSIA